MKELIMDMSLLNSKESIDWYTTGIDLFIEFDYKKHPNIVEELHSIVRKNLPAEELVYCERVWEEDGELGYLLCDNQIDLEIPKIQVMLDEINVAISTIKDSIDVRISGHWKDENKNLFAEIIKGNEGLKLVTYRYY